MSTKEPVFFYWHVRNGDIAGEVRVFGSWNEFEFGTELQFNGTTMYGATIGIAKGKHCYYFEVDGERRIDHTSPIVTSNSYEFNSITCPLNNSVKEASELFKEFMPDNAHLFKDNAKRTVTDLMTFDENTSKLFEEIARSSGQYKQNLKSQLRLKLLKGLGPLPNMSMEENIVEFRRNVTVLRMKLKDEQISSRRRLQQIIDEKNKSHDNLHKIWNEEREKWRTLITQLRTENDSLRNGNNSSIPGNKADLMKRVSDVMDYKDVSNKDDQILAQKQRIEILTFQINELQKELEIANNKGKSNKKIRRVSVAGNGSSVNNIMMGKSILTMNKVIKGLRAEYKELMVVMSQQTVEYENIKTETVKMEKVIKEYSYELENMTHKYKETLQLKRKYFNEIQDLKGNIRVFCRSRPILAIDKCKESLATFLTEEAIKITDANKGKAKTYAFDRVYHWNDSQEKVYKDVSPYIESVMDGYNVCIFAYGQTGSGKTFTMQGNKSNPGINIRALRHLFKIKTQRVPDFEYKMTVSMIEIYNEKIKDLLVSSDITSKTNYKIRQNPNKEMYIENLSKHIVNNEDDVFKLMEKGQKNRSVKSTNSNTESSRSHMVLTINVVGINKIAQMTYVGKIHLIDLAGSERIAKSGVTGQGLKEAQNINKSLSSLGDVMNGLSKKSKHIPYRNSTLTHMLQDSLGGHSKTLMFVNMSPAAIHCSETMNALNFAERAKKIELGPVKKSIFYNQNDDDDKKDDKPARKSARTSSTRTASSRTTPSARSRAKSSGNVLKKQSSTGIARKSAGSALKSKGRTAAARKTTTSRRGTGFIH